MSNRSLLLFSFGPIIFSQSIAAHFFLLRYFSFNTLLLAIHKLHVWVANASFIPIILPILFFIFDFRLRVFLSWFSLLLRPKKKKRSRWTNFHHIGRVRRLNGWAESDSVLWWGSAPGTTAFAACLHSSNDKPNADTVGTMNRTADTNTLVVCGYWETMGKLKLSSRHVCKITGLIGCDECFFPSTFTRFHIDAHRLYMCVCVCLEFAPFPRNLILSAGVGERGHT